jgi:iron-sulfur cluster assembly accessory protein
MAPGASRRLTPATPAIQSEVMETPEAAIKITDVAAGKLKELLAGQEESDQVLRVAVRGGGCSGFQYALALDKRKDDDLVYEHNGVSVVVDKVSMQFVFGSEVDYVEGLQGAGFAVNNPNVVAACGCGSSFQVKEDAEQEPAGVSA